MATTKPTDMPRFAGTDAATPAAAVVEPPSGKKDEGFGLGERVSPGFLDWLFFTLYTWLNFIDVLFTADGDAQGDALLHGSLALQPVGATPSTPQLIARDENDNARFMIDWLGHPAGQIGVHEQHWLIDAANNPDGVGYTFGTAGNGTATYLAPTANMRTRAVRLDTGTVGGGVNAEIVSDQLGFLSDGIQASLEWDFRTGAAIDSGDALNFRAGIAFGTANYYASFTWDGDLSGHIICRMVGATETNHDSGVTLAINTTYRCRIDIWQQGGVSHARFWINGVIVGDFDGPATIVDDSFGYHYRLVNLSGTQYHVDFGRTRMTWDLFPTSDYYTA